MDKNIIGQANKVMVWLMKYYPVRIKNVGEQQKADRQTIWDFKDGRAYEQVALMTAKHRIHLRTCINAREERTALQAFFGKGMRTHPCHQRLSPYAGVGRTVGSTRTPKGRNRGSGGTNGRL